MQSVNISIVAIFAVLAIAVAMPDHQRRLDNEIVRNVPIKTKVEYKKDNKLDPKLTEQKGTLDQKSVVSPDKERIIQHLFGKLSKSDDKILQRQFPFKTKSFCSTPEHRHRHGHGRRTYKFESV